jgi:hypothetical protein
MDVSIHISWWIIPATITVWCIYWSTLSTDYSVGVALNFSLAKSMVVLAMGAWLVWALLT